MSLAGPGVNVSDPALQPENPGERARESAPVVAVPEEPVSDRKRGALDHFPGKRANVGV